MISTSQMYKHIQIRDGTDFDLSVLQNAKKKPFLYLDSRLLILSNTSSD